MDVTTHHKWKFLGDEVLVSFKAPDERGVLWVDRIPSALLRNLQHASYQQLLDDFDDVGGDASDEQLTLFRRCRHMFGHVAYRLNLKAVLYRGNVVRSIRGTR